MSRLTQDVLRCPMQPNDAKAATIGEYLSRLLLKLWRELDGFSGKRPFGNSSWQYEVYEALGKAGFVEIIFDEDGYIDSFSQEQEDKADELIREAIKAMAQA